MASKIANPVGAFGKMHTAGIFANMTVDGPNIGTLVVIMDRAKNLPNRRSMGKQDPYCAARLGKEAKKTNTDKRGGQTPRWDQELRFPVHDSPDYHNLKVSVFNDDKKTELIGETFVSLENVLVPGGGQSDGWHGLNCKGKYAGEIRIELTYYDTRPKEKAPVERKKESARQENGSVAVGGPRESTPPVKRRPLPSDPTGAVPSSATPAERPRLSAQQSGPRALGQRRSQHPEVQPSRRPVPDASPLNTAPVPTQYTPQHQQHTSQPEPDAFSGSLNPAVSAANTPQHNGDSVDASSSAPKAYEAQPINPLPLHVRETSHRAASQDNVRHSQNDLSERIDPPHSYSAPVVPTQQSNGYYQQEQQFEGYAQPQDPYQDHQYQVEPLRPSRSNSGLNEMSFPDPYQAPNGYPEMQDPYTSPRRSYNDLQATVEDEDDTPPPPPVHRSNAATVSHHQHQAPPSYHHDAPAPLNVTRYREEPQGVGYDSPPQSYAVEEYSLPSPTDRRYTHPRPNSRPVSRDTMMPSPLRTETAMLPASLIAGIDPSRADHRMSVHAATHESPVYQASPSSYDTPGRLRQLSEPNYATPPQYETPPPAHPLANYQSAVADDAPDYYPYAAPEEPRHVSPVLEPLALVKPQAMVPAQPYYPVENRTSRSDLRSMPTRKSVSPRPPPSAVDHYAVENRASRSNLRSMPTRKSVSPRPPPSADPGERRLSGVPFAPDSFDVYNPTVSKKTKSSSNEKSGDRDVEVNEKGQVVTFSGRVIDASDHLPLDSWAPEPEPKGTVKERRPRDRAMPGGSRDLDAAMQRERDYRRERAEKEGIRNMAQSVLGDSGSPSNALVTSRHHYGSSSGSPMNAGAMVLHGSESPGRSRLQKQRPNSSFIPGSSSPSNMSVPSHEVLRDRSPARGYGGNPGGYGANTRHAPPIPAKVPMEHGHGHSDDMTALSMELQTIDIGPSSGRSRGTTRHRYGGY